MARRSKSTGVTIADVAALAGVSTATVSRALANPDLVRPETVQRVMAAAASIGFTPNSSARNLRRQRTEMVLVVMTTIAYHHYADTLRGIDEALAARDYGFIVGSLEGMPGKEGRFVDLAFSRQVDGVILVSGVVPKSKGRTLADAGLPMVAILAPVAEPVIPTIVVDEEAMGREAARYLTGLGHRRLGYVAGPRGHLVDVARWTGFSQEAALLGLPASEVVRFEGDPAHRFAFPSGLVAGEAFLAAADRPTAVFCSSDEMAISFMKVVRGAGLGVPGDVSVLGADGIVMADLTDPPLSTFRQPRQEMGRLGAEMLMGMLDNGPLSTFRQPREEMGRLGAEMLMGMLDGVRPPPSQLTLMPVELLRRGTTAPPAPFAGRA